jgi:histidine triad (HIT) family protein
MYSHAPKDYKCPICLAVNGVENEDTLMRQADIVFKDELVSAFINSFWLKGNEGHMIVVTNDHFENLYEIPEEIGSRIFKVSKEIAIAMKKAYKCDGVTIRQNNEPASDQHAFHYHMHIFPRYDNDKFGQSDKFLSDEKERGQFVAKIKAALKNS